MPVCNRAWDVANTHGVRGLHTCLQLGMGCSQNSWGAVSKGMHRLFDAVHRAWPPPRIDRPKAVCYALFLQTFLSSRRQTCKASKACHKLPLEMATSLKSPALAPLCAAVCLLPCTPICWHAFQSKRGPTTASRQGYLDMVSSHAPGLLKCTNRHP